MSLALRAAVVTVAIFLAFVAVWHLATRGTGQVAQMDPEYAKLMGVTATQGKSAMPGPLDVGAKLWEHLKRPFYDNGPNDKGVGIQASGEIGLSTWMKGSSARPIKGDMPIRNPIGTAASTASR